MLRSLYQIFRALTRHERTAFITAAIICVIATFAGFWLRFYTHTTLTPAQGGEYTEGIVGQPTAINPMLIGSSPADSELVPALFADIVTLSQNIATSTTGKVWVVTLKDDIVWSDGKALTADDVIFTVRTIQNPDANSPLWSNWQGVTIERISQREVRFTLKAAYSLFIENLRGLRIAPAHIFESIPPSNIRLSTYNFEPVSSGPYVFTSYEKERSGFISSYHLTVNRKYVGNQALIETFIFRFFPSYTDALIGFNRKSIDGIGGFEPASIDGLKIRHHIYEAALPQYFAIFFNQSSQPLFKDKHVRAALRLATDNGALVQDIFGGYATPLWGPLLPQLADYSAETYATAHSSSEEAAKLLDKQQWRIGSDGVRFRTVGKNTQRLAFELTVPDIEFLVETAENIKVQWQKIGVQLSLKKVPAQDIQREVIKSRTYSALLYGNLLQPANDLFAFWHSSQRLPPGLNLSGYQSAAADQAIETSRKTFNEEARKTALAKIQKSIAEDNPAIFLFAPKYVYASSDDLGGFPTGVIASSHDRMSTIASWFLETSRVYK